MRTENSKTFSIGNGRYYTNISNGAIHYKDNYSDPLEQWKDIDLTIRSNQVTKAPYNLTINPISHSVNVQDKKTKNNVLLSVTGLASGNLSSFNINSVIKPLNTGVRLILPHDATIQVSKSKIESVKGSQEIKPTISTSLSVLEKADGSDTFNSIDKPLETFSTKVNSTIDIQVSAITDDCYVTPSASSISLNNNLILGNNGFSNHNGVRFQNVTIPVGATINTAYITFIAISGSTDTTNLICYGENPVNANPNTYSTYADFMTRILTTGVNWNALAHWSAETSYSTPTLVNQVNEIITNANWASGNAMAFQFRDNGSSLNANRTAYSVDTDPAKSANLHIEYLSLSVPTLTTEAVTDITTTTAIAHGTIVSAMPSAGTRGICYSSVNNPPTISDSVVSESGSFISGSFTKNLIGLTPSTTYFVRAYATNIIGTGYGNTVNFMTLPITDPSIITMAASDIATTTARLNSNVADDGGEPCHVQFAWARTALGPFANYAAIAAAGFVMNATGTFNTGQSPYVSISSLLTNTSYTFCTRIINSHATQYGGQLTFSSLSFLGSPTNLKGIPTSTTISLFWSKGSGSTNTLIKYKKGSYPTSSADGTTAYFSSLASVTITGLDRGTTYYFRAWGESGGTYSATNATLLLTTLAYTSSSINNATISTPNFWFQAPDYTRMSNFFMYDWLNWFSDTLSMPRSTFWFLGSILLQVIVGIVLYALHPNLVITLIAVGIVGLVFVFMGLQPMWLLFPYFVIGIASIFVGERR